MTVDAFWQIWGSLGRNWLSVVVSWGGPWAGLGLVLEPVDSFWDALAIKRSSKVLQGSHLADIVETYENSSVFIGFRGWGLPRSHQNGILDTLVAQLGCLEGCLGLASRFPLIFIDFHGFGGLGRLAGGPGSNGRMPPVAADIVSH